MQDPDSTADNQILDLSNDIGVVRMGVVLTETKSLKSFPDICFELLLNFF